MKKWIVVGMVAAVCASVGFAAVEQQPAQKSKPQAKEEKKAVQKRGLAASQLSWDDGKLCSAVSPNQWRDTISMPDDGQEADCQSWQSQVGSSSYQLGCLIDNGSGISFSVGPQGGGAPSPNCGW